VQGNLWIRLITRAVSSKEKKQCGSGVFAAGSVPGQKNLQFQKTFVRFCAVGPQWWMSPAVRQMTAAGGKTVAEHRVPHRLPFTVAFPQPPFDRRSIMIHKSLTVVAVALSFLAPLASEARAQNGSPTTVLHVTNNTGRPMAFTVRFIRSDGASRVWTTPKLLDPGETATLSDSGVIASRRENNTTYYLIWIQGVPQDGGTPLWWGKSGNALKGVRGVEWMTEANNGVSKHITVTLVP
jgi:hypothetical protein